jgi:hypothetical protein
MASEELTDYPSHELSGNLYHEENITIFDIVSTWGIVRKPLLLIWDNG